MPEIILYIRCRRCRESVQLPDSTMLEGQSKTLRRLPKEDWKRWVFCPHCSATFIAKTSAVTVLRPQKGSHSLQYVAYSCVLRYVFEM